MCSYDQGFIAKMEVVICYKRGTIGVNIEHQWGGRWEEGDGKGVSPPAD